MVTQPNSGTQPSNELEIGLLKIWEDVLRIPQPSIDDSFFRIGGHSLSATRLISRINNTYNVDLKMKLIFEHPTIREQAMLVEEMLIEQLDQLPDDAILTETENADFN